MPKDMTPSICTGACGRAIFKGDGDDKGRCVYCRPSTPSGASVRKRSATRKSKKK